MFLSLHWVKMLKHEIPAVPLLYDIRIRCCCPGRCTNDDLL